jgi:hypothetical protein
MSGKKKLADVKPVFLRGLKPENHSWVKDEAKKRGYTLSGFVNRLFETAQTKKW